MGGCMSISRYLGYFTRRRDQKIMMLGLDGAGKTVILYKLKSGLTEEITTQPTIGFNIETVSCVDRELTIWDGGGNEKIRPLWRRFFQQTKGIIYVIDSADRERLGETKEELNRVLYDDELVYAPLLILANKQDLPGALLPSEIVEILDLDSLQDGRHHERPWHVQQCSAIKNGKGLVEGMEWLSDQVE